MHSLPKSVSWASHAARVHGYRAPGTRLARGRTCRGCGRIYAPRSDIWITLSFACCIGALSSRIVTSPMHLDTYRPRLLQPRVLLGRLAIVGLILQCVVSSVPSWMHDLLQAVGRHFAPLAVLRNTVQQWASQFRVDHNLHECGEQACALLYREYLCEEAQPFPKARPSCTDEPLTSSFGLRGSGREALESWFHPKEFTLLGVRRLDLSASRRRRTVPTYSSLRCWSMPGMPRLRRCLEELFQSSMKG